MIELEVDGKLAAAGTGGTAFDPDLPAVVLVHGAGMDHTVWALQSRYFAHRGRAVLAVDLPGHGASEGPPLDSPPAIADWLARFIQAAGLEQSAFVGHSMGALAALECAARHSEKVRGLALLGAAARMPVHPDLLSAAEANDSRAAAMIVGWGHGARAHLGGHPAPGIWQTGAGYRLLERAPPGVLHTDLVACNAYDGGVEAAGRVRCPALVVVGVEDRMTPAKAGRELASAIADARVIELARAGHMMMTEQPRETLEALKMVV